MTQPIFGLRFKSNEAIQPDTLELSAFLQTPRAPGSAARQGDDLAAYVEYLSRIDAYEARKQEGLARFSFDERMFLGVLSHCRFFNPALRIAVEEYKYHHHQLQAVDLRKPQAFIRSAEIEIGKLNAKKKDDQLKVARFQDMIAQRRRDIEKLIQRRAMLAGELYHITVYVIENLLRIRQLCETTIGHIAELHVGGEKTSELVEDVKMHFKLQVRESMEAGPVRKDYLESLKAEVAELTRTLSKLVLEDLYAVTRIYETLYEHANERGKELQRLADQADKIRKANAAAGWEIFARIEKELVAIIGKFRIEPRTPVPSDGPHGHASLVMKKRQEMLDHIFDLLRAKQLPWRS